MGEYKNLLPHIIHLQNLQRKAENGGSEHQKYALYHRFSLQLTTKTTKKTVGGGHSL